MLSSFFHCYSLISFQSFMDKVICSGGYFCLTVLTKRPFFFMSAFCNGFSLLAANVICRRYDRFHLHLSHQENVQDTDVDPVLILKPGVF